MSDNNPRPSRALPALANPTSQRPARTLPPLKSPNRSGDESLSVPRRVPRRRREKSPTTSTPETAEEGRSQEQATSDSAQPNDANTTQSRQKRRRRPKEPMAQQQTTESLHKTLISELENEEDLVNVDCADGPVTLTNLPGIATGIGGSAQNDKVYVETTSGFVSRNTEWIKKRNEMADYDATLAYGEDRVKPFDVAEQHEKGFMYISLALHGVLSGFAIFHVIFAYSLYQPLDNRTQTQNFLTQYRYLAVPAQTVYYVVLTVLFVSAMDRYDFASKEKHFFDSLVKFDLAAVSVFIYFVAFGFSIGLSGLDIWIGSGVGITTDTTTTMATLTTLPPILTGSQLDPTSTVNTWLIINVLRMVFAVLGWLIVAFDPTRNDMKWEGESPTRFV